MKFRITAKICSAKLVHRFHCHGYRAYWQQCGVNVIPYGRCLLLLRLGKTAEMKHSFVSDNVKIFPRNKWSNVCFTVTVLSVGTILFCRVRRTYGL
jgi:hypothetical protein